MKAIESLEELLNNTENGCYEYDFEASLDGKLYYVEIKVVNATLIEMSNFLKELDIWKKVNDLKDFQIIITKNKQY